MEKTTLLNNIAAIKGIGPKALQKIENEIDKYEQENAINMPYCNDFKIEFYDEFGYDGLENAQKSGEISAYGVLWDESKGLQSIAEILSNYGQLTENQDSYSGAVVTMEFCSLNG